VVVHRIIYGREVKTSCPVCRAIICNDLSKMPRCPQCGDIAYKVNVSPDGKSIFFVHDIKIVNGEIADLGHKVNNEGFK
jgi:Zn finger protein HypA/HybF involved in hydrogenase expression